MNKNGDVYLQPTASIDADHPSVREKARELTDPDATPADNAIKLFYFVRDRIRYNPFSPMLNPEDYLASEVLARGFGFCVQKAVLLAALARAVDIPARLCFADIRNHIVPGDLRKMMGTNLFVYHGYVAFFLNNNWVKATPAFDIAMCDKHGIVPVDFDGIRDAIFHPLNRDGQKHIEYVRDRGCFADVPYKEIIAAFEETYMKGNPELEKAWRSLASDRPKP